MEYTACDRGVDARQAGDSGTRTRPFERIPRGQCKPPIAPAPDPKRGEAMKHIMDGGAHSTNQNRRRRSSQILVMSQGRGSPRRKTTPKWKKGYLGFKRKVKSSALIPLLLIASLCGVGLSIVGLAGVSFGFFAWSVGCEGVVTVTGDSGRATGLQTYNLGWVRYNGKGPTTTADSPTLPVDPTNEHNNGTVGSDLSKGGVAGSSIPEEGWLAGIDRVSASFGALTAVGHAGAFAFYSSALFTAQNLFRSHFQSNRRLFRFASRGAASLLVWMVGIGWAGFYLSARKIFTASVLSTLHNEGFLCEDESEFDGEFSFLAANGAGCFVGAFTFLLTWWFGDAADLALAESFERRKESRSVIDP